MSRQQNQHRHCRTWLLRMPRYPDSPGSPHGLPFHGGKAFRQDYRTGVQKKPFPANGSGRNGRARNLMRNSGLFPGFPRQSPRGLRLHPHIANANRRNRQERDHGTSLFRPCENPGKSYSTQQRNTSTKNQVWRLDTDAFLDCPPKSMCFVGKHLRRNRSYPYTTGHSPHSVYRHPCSVTGRYPAVQYETGWYRRISPSHANTRTREYQSHRILPLLFSNGLLFFPIQYPIASHAKHHHYCPSEPTTRS